MDWKRLALLSVFQLLWMGNALAQPTMFWFNDPVGPDETVLVTGADLDGVTAAVVARVPDPGSTAAPTAETPVDILQANPRSLKFVIPKAQRKK